MRRRLRWYGAIALLAMVPLLFSNCSKKFAANVTPASGGGDGAFPTPPGGGTGKSVPLTSTTYYTVDGSGTITVYQDKELSYSPVGSGSLGTYSISALPAWATSFDTTTGTIVGTPHSLTDAGTFTVTEVSPGTGTFGPFTVHVVGDAFKEQQWPLLNIGQTGFALTAGTAGADIHMGESVKKNILGIGVRVAISDSGVYIAHPDLTDNVLPNESRNYNQTYKGSWLGDPTPASTNPDDAHGTAVAGLFAAKGWNGIGGRGVAPESRIAAFLFIEAQDTLSQQGYLNAALLDQFNGNFDIFNYSWGDPQCALTEFPSFYNDKLAAGVANQRSGKGSVFVMAAGNSFIEDINDCVSSIPAGSDFVFGNSNFSEGTTTPYTINVAATNADGVASSYSSPGPANWISSTGGEFGFSSAVPGEPERSQPALVTTDYPGCNNGISSTHKTNSTFDAGGSGNTTCDYTNTMNGTSGATPIAGGAIAMMLQVNPNLTWRDVKHILAKTADKVDPTAAALINPPIGTSPGGYTYEQGWVTNNAGFHFHNWYGFGRINVDNAVAMAKTYNVALGTFKTTGFKYSSGTISAAIPDYSATGVTKTMNVTDSMVVEAVQLRLSTDGCASDVGLELTSPAGTKSILMNIASRLRDGPIVNHIFLSNAFYGESSAGTWTLKVVDGRATCTANLTKWELNFFGH